ncbi:MAG: dockerin type I repeat-containing protein [Clostridia bacterium]|nr:dockerin type I repeat-containing protein [Clostridia bacterium]
MKRAICLILCAVLLTTCGVLSASAGTARLGDVNGNGKLEAQDYAMIKRAVLKTYTLNDSQLLIADVNRDGKLDSGDYARVKRAVLRTYELNGTVDIPDPVSGWQDEEGNWRSTMDPKPYRRSVFRVLVRGEDYGLFRSEDICPAETGSLLGSAFGEAVLSRNGLVKQTYGIDVLCIESNQVQEDVQSYALAGMDEFDAVMDGLGTLLDAAPQGYYYDLRSIQGLDLDAPWYDPYANETFTFGNAQYFATGDVTVTNRTEAPAIVFSRSIVAENDFESPYELVKDHTWTLDAMAEVMRSVVEERDGNGFIDEQDVVGMLADPFSDPFRLWGGAGNRIVRNDGENGPRLDVKSEASVDTAYKIFGLIAENDGSIFITKPGETDAKSLFAKGHALFLPAALRETVEIRRLADEAGRDVGILPLPLRNMDQESYLGVCVANAAGIAIPISSRAPEFCASMIDICSAGAKNVMTPALRDALLAGSRNYEDELMLDVLFDSVRYDLGACMDFGGLKFGFAGLAKAGSTNYTAFVDSKLTSAEVQLLNLLERYRELAG